MNSTTTPGHYIDFWLLARSGLSDTEKSELELCVAASEAQDSDTCYWDLNLEKYSTESHKFVAYRMIKYTDKTMTEITDFVTNEVYIHTRLQDGQTVSDET